MYRGVGVSLLVVASLVLVSGQKYTTKYDNVDIDSILENDRLLSNYVNCLLEKGKCSPDGLELKKNIPDALETDCSKCSEKQKEGVQKVLKYIYEKKPEIYKEVEAKYDPQGKYKLRYKDRVPASGKA